MRSALHPAALVAALLGMNAGASPSRAATPMTFHPAELPPTFVGDFVLGAAARKVRFGRGRATPSKRRRTNTKHAARRVRHARKARRRR